MLRDERLELAGQLGVAAARARSCSMRSSSAGQLEILQTRDLGLGETAVREVGERRAAPERERLRRPAALLQPSETLQIELVRLDTEQVAGRLRRSRSLPISLRSPETYT